ncbi:hypothetical protein PSV08DRAFT_365316 [Bipolaris maydis]|nr:hypothetical protein PSV08DRAFT_365316 [Bipolaris maydis]
MNSSPFRIICSAVLLLWSNLSHHMFRNEYTKTTWDVLLLRIVSCCLLLALYNHAKFRQHSLWDLYETSETHFHSPKYPPLKGNDIRILALLPSTDRTAPLRGRFETHNLNNDNETSNKADKTGYEAVFYNKTTPPTMGSIVIESTIVVIPVHLQRALFWLRHAHKERRLWADAICINHSDLLEEFTQISLFPQIFKRATKAIAWVGEPKEAEEEASRPFLEALQHPSSFLLFIRSGGIAHASGLKVLIKPLKRWKLISRKRAGLCRELMLAGRISLQLGRYEIPGLFLVLLMWNYTKALRLPRLERGTNALLRLDASAALGVKASLIDFVEVFINNEKEQYDNGLFFEPWVARGVIEELLTMLRRSGKDSVSLKTLENLASLLDATYPLLEQDVNSSNRYEAYNTRGTTTKRMMIATRDRRLLEIDRILGLKQASPGSQKKDGVFLGPKCSEFLAHEPFSPLSTRNLDLEKYSALADPFFMDYHPYWSKVVTHVANGAPGTVYPIPVIKEKKFQLNEKSRAELRHLVKSNRVDSTHSNFVKDTTDRTTKPKIHVENEIERPHSVATTEKSYRLSWTCPCGHRGLDHYTEHRPGAVRELLETLQEHATSGPTNGSLPSTSSGNVDSSNSNQPLQTSIGLSTASQATSGPQNWRFSASTAHTQVNSTNINISEDFILLCMKVKRFLTNRYDLQVSTITRDRELFEALRREYHSKFRWAYRQFSFQTVQRMSFVKFTLHARKEVDGLVSDMPPETVKHYTCDPRKPDRTPPLGSDFLMHRFSSPKDCFQDNICLRQFPKRIGERPTPGVDPDLYTGWGVHLEQDMDLQRICLVLFFGIASAGMFGLVWGICKKSLQDGFSVASFVLGSEAIAVPIRSASK